MKKTKMISLAAAALLAVAPVVTSTMPVSAADNAQSNNNQTQTTPSQTNTTDAATTQTQATDALAAQYTHDGKSEQINPNNQTFQIAANSSFDPTNIALTNGNTVKITGKTTVISNNVDTSKAGSSFTVELSGVDKDGKETKVSYQVFVKPEGLFQLNLSGNSDYVKGLGDTDTFYQGRNYYVGNNVRYERGEFFTGVSTVSQVAANGNTNAVLWIQTKYLASSEQSKPDLVQKTIMHTALGYTAAGTKTSEKFSQYSTVYVKNDPIHIDGGKYYTSGTFYQIYNADGTYTNYYVKASNIDGTKRTLTRNAYIYATSTRRSSYTLLKKGTTITTYGGTYKFKNGKRYYRIEGATATNKRYVKAVNFE